MKTRNILYFLSLFIGATSTALIGMHESAGWGRPTETLNPSSGTHRETTATELDYLEQRRLLKEEENPKPTPQPTTPAPSKPTFLQGLIQRIKGSKPKPSSQPPTEVTTATLDSEGLTQADREAIIKINETHQLLDATRKKVQGVMNISEATHQFQKKTVVLEELFKAELKKRYPSLPKGDIDLLAKELKKTVTTQLTQFGKLLPRRGTSPNDIPYLKNIRDEMDRLLTDPLQEVTALKAKPTAAKQGAQETDQKETSEAKNPAIPEIVSVKPSFTKKTETSLNMLKHTLNLIKNLSSKEKKEVEDILNTLNDALKTLQKQGPSLRDWLFRKNKKWSAQQEQAASAAIKTAMSDLTTFVTNRARQEQTQEINTAQLNSLQAELDVIVENLPDGKNYQRSIINKIMEQARQEMDEGKTWDKISENIEKQLTENKIKLPASLEPFATLPPQPAPLKNLPTQKEELTNPIAKPGKFELRELTAEEKSTNPQGFGQANSQPVVLMYGVKELELESVEKSLVSSIKEFRDQKPLTYAIKKGNEEYNVQSPTIRAWNQAEQKITTITERFDQQIRDIYFNKQGGRILSKGLKKDWSPQQKAEAKRLAQEALEAINKIKATYVEQTSPQSSSSPTIRESEA
jgi:hypothetical protein